MRMISVRLPVRNLQVSKAFFAELGFTFNPELSGEETACVLVDQNIYMMLWAMPEVADGESGLPVTSTASSRVRHDVCMDAPRPAGVMRGPCSRDRNGAHEQACHARAGSRAVSAAAGAGGAPAQRRWSAKVVRVHALFWQKNRRICRWISVS